MSNRQLPGFNPIEFDGFAGYAELASRLYEQMQESIELDTVIRRNLEVLGYGK